MGDPEPIQDAWGAARDEFYLVRCSSPPDRGWEGQGLVCRFSNNLEVPAMYDQQQGCISCQPPADQLCQEPDLEYDVVGEDGSTLLHRLLSESKVERVGQSANVVSSYEAPTHKGVSCATAPDSFEQAPAPDSYVVSCKPPEVDCQGQGLVCRFSNNLEVPALYDQEQGCISCRPPADKLGEDQDLKDLQYDVVAENGATLLHRLLSESKVERVRQAKGVDDITCVPPSPMGAMDVTSGPGEPGGAAGGGSGRGKYKALVPFSIITICYLLFTVTDGAVRMIVLFHAYSKGFTAMETAIMFSMYELAGVFTNFLAGIAGARWGIRSTLVVGLALQLAGIGMLFGWQDDWLKLTAIIYVTAAQMLCGIAKDLTKLGGKTVTKLVTPDEKQAMLFKLVSFITGFKNSLKGGGYFLGSVLIIISYELALGVLMGIIGIALPFAIFGLRKDLGRTRKENISMSAIFKKNHNINTLSLSRLFLFGSRDLWFEVPLPFFMRDVVYGLGWGRAAVGAALAIFIIVYGQIQSWTPQLVCGARTSL